MVRLYGGRTSLATKDGYHGPEMEIRPLGSSFGRRLMRNRGTEVGRLGDAKLSAGPGTRAGERGARQSTDTNLRREISDRFERTSQT